MRNLTTSMMEAGAALGQAAIDAAVTIAHRTPILATCLVRPTSAGLAEWERASSEKITAGWDGAMAAWSAWQRVAWDALATPMTPLGVATYSLQLARVSARPAMDCARANALRLNGR